MIKSLSDTRVTFPRRDAIMDINFIAACTKYQQKKAPHARAHSRATDVIDLNIWSSKMKNVKIYRKSFDKNACPNYFVCVKPSSKNDYL